MLYCLPVRLVHSLENVVGWTGGYLTLLPQMQRVCTVNRKSSDPVLYLGGHRFKYRLAVLAKVQ